MNAMSGFNIAFAGKFAVRCLFALFTYLNATAIFAFDINTFLVNLGAAALAALGLHLMIASRSRAALFRSYLRTAGTLCHNT